MKHNKEVTVNWGDMSADYKATVIQATDDMPAEGTLQQQSKYVFDQMEAAHKEIVWGVELIKFTPGKLDDTAYLFNSPNAS